jgi:hypothetical protein
MYDVSQVSADETVDRPTKSRKPRTKSGLPLKRKRSDSSSALPTPKQRRKASGAQSSGNVTGSLLKKTGTGEWNTLRTFCLDKLKKAFANVFVAYRQRIIRDETKEVNEKEKEKESGVYSDEEKGKGTDDMEIDEEVKDQHDVILPDEIVDEIQKLAEAYAVEVERGLFDKKKEFDKDKGGFQAMGAYRQVEPYQESILHD